MPMQALEERFNAMIEPAVSSALAARQGDRVADLSMLMASAGREHELEGLYIAARLPMFQVQSEHIQGPAFFRIMRIPLRYVSFQWKPQALYFGADASLSWHAGTTTRSRMV